MAEQQIKVGDFVDIVSGDQAEEWERWTFCVTKIDEATQIVQIIPAVFGGRPFNVNLADLRLHTGDGWGASG
jgi:hypothetical protein